MNLRDFSSRDDDFMDKSFEASGTVLAWRVHLLRERPTGMLLVAPVVLAGLGFAYALSGSPILLAAVLLLFASSLAEYLFPVAYELTEEGASVRTLTGRNFVAWERVKKYYLDGSGIKLSTLERPGRLEAYRGVYLRFGGNREEVERAVRRMRDAVRGDAGAL